MTTYVSEVEMTTDDELLSEILGSYTRFTRLVDMDVGTLDLLEHPCGCSVRRSSVDSPRINKDRITVCDEHQDAFDGIGEVVTYGFYEDHVCR